MIHQKKFVTISIGYRIYKMLGVLCLCVLVYSCGSKSPLTMRLFMQAGGATVGLPNTSSADSVFTVSETVGFRDSVVVDNPVSSVDSLEEDIWKSIDMDRIDIVAQRKSIERILERNGEVTLMFYVKAPKVLLDSCWKLTMYPELIEKDSSVLLSPVILRGKEFIRTQESQYKAYNDFLRGIIPESKYDSAFRALGILEKYPDYNTAVALTCLGYHAKSEDLLKQLPQTAAVEYLRAIVNVRLEDYQAAAELLLEACRKDTKYVYRTEMDSDIAALLPRFMGLKEELERIASEE